MVNILVTNKISRMGKPRRDSAVCHHLLNCRYSPFRTERKPPYHERQTISESKHMFCPSLSV